MGYSNKIMADKNAEIKKYESVSPIEQTQQTESNEYNALLAECDKYKLEIQSLHDLQSKMENMNESEIINEQNHKIIALESELNHSKNLNDTQIETIGKFKQLVKEQNEELEKKKNTNIEQMKMNNAIQTELREMKQKNMNQNIQDLDNVFTEMKETENENVSDSNDQNIKRMSNQQIERMSELNMNIELKDNDRQLDTIKALKSELAQSQNIINELKNKNIADSNMQLNGLKNEYKKELTLRLKTNKKISILEQLFRSKLTAIGIDVDGWNNLEEMNQNEIKLLQKKMRKYDQAEFVKKQTTLKHELETLRSQLEDAGNIISDLRQKNDALNDEIIEDLQYSNKIMADKNAEIKKYESVSPTEQIQQTESNEYNALLAECDKYKLEIQSLHELQSKMENMNESEIINEQNHKIIELESELNHSKNLNDTQIETIGKFKQLVKEQNEELEKMKNTNIEQMKMNNAIQTELREMKQKNMNQNIQDLDNVFTEMKETENENVSDSNDQNIKRMSNQQIERMSELNMNIELKDNDRQ